MSLYGISKPSINGHRFPAENDLCCNFRNSLFQKRSVFDFLGCFENYLGVRNFRVYEILEHLPYYKYIFIDYKFPAVVTTA